MITPLDTAPIAARLASLPDLVRMPPYACSNATIGFAPVDQPLRYVVGTGVWIEEDDPLSTGISTLLLDAKGDIAALLGEIERLRAENTRLGGIVPCTHPNRVIRYHARLAGGGSLITWACNGCNSIWTEDIPPE